DRALPAGSGAADHGAQEDFAMMNARQLGSRADLVQIIEFHGPTHDAQWMLPDAAPPMLAANASWLADQYWMPRTNRLVFTYQLWIVKLGEAIVLVDTGC